MDTDCFRHCRWKIHPRAYTQHSVKVYMCMYKDSFHVHVKKSSSCGYSTCCKSIQVHVQGLFQTLHVRKLILMRVHKIFWKIYTYACTCTCVYTDCMFCEKVIGWGILCFVRKRSFKPLNTRSKICLWSRYLHSNQSENSHCSSSPHSTSYCPQRLAFGPPLGHYHIQYFGKQLVPAPELRDKCPCFRSLRRTWN